MCIRDRCNTASLPPPLIHFTYTISERPLQLIRKECIRVVVLGGGGLLSSSLVQYVVTRHGRTCSGKVYTMRGGVVVCGAVKF